MNGCLTNVGAWNTINWAAVGFTVPPVVVGSAISQGSTAGGSVEFTGISPVATGSPTTVGCSLLSRATGGASGNEAALINIVVIGY